MVKLVYFLHIQQRIEFCLIVFLVTIVGDDLNLRHFRYLITFKLWLLDKSLYYF